LDLEVDRQAGGDLQIGGGEGQAAVIGGVQEHPGQRRDPRSRGHPALNGLQRLGQLVTVASELHQGLLLFLGSFEDQ
jgi:hypothetical protein